MFESARCLTREWRNKYRPDGQDGSPIEMRLAILAPLPCFLTHFFFFEMNK